MCVTLSQPVSCCSSFFSLSSSPIPPSSPSPWFELDNENNEFGVCFFLCVSRPPPLLSLHLARPVSLSHGDPVSYSLAHARKPPTFISLLRISSVCFVVFPPCVSPFHPPFCPHSLSVSYSFSISLSRSLSLSAFLCDFMLQLLYYQSV